MEGMEERRWEIAWMSNCVLANAEDTNTNSLRMLEAAIDRLLYLIL